MVQEGADSNGRLTRTGGWEVDSDRELTRMGANPNRELTRIGGYLVWVATALQLNNITTIKYRK